MIVVTVPRVMVVVRGVTRVLLGWRCTLLLRRVLLILLTVILALRGVDTATSTSIIACGWLLIGWLSLVASAALGLIVVGRGSWRVLHVVSSRPATPILIHILVVESLLSCSNLLVPGIIVIVSLHGAVHHVGVGVGADHCRLVALVRTRRHIVVGWLGCGTLRWLLLLIS